MVEQEKKSTEEIARNVRYDFFEEIASRVNANKIAVINEGELVELGTHDDLLSKENGFYKKLYEMQFAKKESVSAQ